MHRSHTGEPRMPRPIPFSAVAVASVAMDVAVLCTLLRSGASILAIASSTASIGFKLAGSDRVPA